MSRIEDWRKETQGVLKDIEEFQSDDDAIYLLEPIAVILDKSSSLVGLVIPWLTPVFKVISSILKHYAKKG